MLEIRARKQKSKHKCWRIEQILKNYRNNFMWIFVTTSAFFCESVATISKNL